LPLILREGIRHGARDINRPQCQLIAGRCTEQESQPRHPDLHIGDLFDLSCPGKSSGQDNDLILLYVFVSAPETR